MPYAPGTKRALVLYADGLGQPASQGIVVFCCLTL